MKREEIEALELIRQLDERQREKLMARLKREVLANKIVIRVGKLSELKIADDRKIERAFGAVPTWRVDRKAK